MKFQMDREKARPRPPPASRLRARFRQDRFVILACDGFWNAWTAAEAIEFTHSLVANEEGPAVPFAAKSSASCGAFVSSFRGGQIIFLAPLGCMCHASDVLARAQGRAELEADSIDIRGVCKETLSADLGSAFRYIQADEHDGGPPLSPFWQKPKQGARTNALFTRQFGGFRGGCETRKMPQRRSLCNTLSRRRRRRTAGKFVVVPCHVAFEQMLFHCLAIHE